jgi:UDP:flavonoid glycosyltransferase YjiC (YdhE family)
LWETDLIVNQLPGGLYGSDLAEKLDIPMILAAVMPLTPTRHQPMLAFPPQLAPVPGYNRFTHWLAYQLVWQGYRPAISRWRKRTLGLSKAPLWGYARWMEEKRVPVLNGFSAYVVPRPPDWDKHVHITGYWFPEAADWQPPDELCEFIHAGPPPVFIGFGSMPIRDPKRTTAIVLDALKQSGRRAILHAGWAGIGGQDLPATVFKVDDVPYGWLFPQMAAVVHHGGSGTTAFGLRAGVPSIVVPFLFDQFYWGRRVAALGVGPEPIAHKRLSAQKLAKALLTAVDDAQMRQRAAQLGAKIRAEGGVSAAVDTILKIVR